jgi:hypothetical protein
MHRDESYAKLVAQTRVRVDVNKKVLVCGGSCRWLAFANKSGGVLETGLHAAMLQHRGVHKAPVL